MPTYRKVTIKNQHFTREDHLLVMPQSKLWIGTFVCFHHAFKHLSKLIGLEQNADHRWFIVKKRFWPKAASNADGWVQLDEPIPMQLTHKAYLPKNRYVGRPPNVQ
jgi:hypothetical protein